MIDLRKAILRRLLNPAQLAVVKALDQPDRWMPDAGLTAIEAEAWASLLRTPLLLKIDHAMINWMQQEAQRALLAPQEHLARQAGMALGCRAGWEMAKTLSRLAAATGDQTEPTAPTAAATLDHLQP